MQNLNKRKTLAAKVLGVGEGRILFDTSRLADIKDAITKQDIRDMFAEGIISLREIKGRKTKPARKTKRGPGKIKMTINPSKKRYVIIVRKLRRHVRELRNQGKITKVQELDLRKKIKARLFKDKAHLKEHLENKK